MTYKSQMRSILAVDMIRLLKLLEISQYTILAAVSAIILGPVINEITPMPTNTDNKIILLLYIFGELALLGIFTYYIRKIILLTPFFFSWVSNKYINNRGGSSILAIGIGLGLVFNRTQTKLLKKIDILSIYIKDQLGI